MQEVVAFPFDCLMTFSHFLSLLFPVGWTVFLPRKFALFTLESITFFGQV
ncbi:MAG: hypothetical protein J07HX5_01929 [halophilic archaeon J07HX5]|nr:MAG: hypothetical protein J07HX5_01929 [halophilic archaeon J07HX5]